MVFFSSNEMHKTVSISLNETDVNTSSPGRLQTGKSKGQLWQTQTTLAIQPESLKKATT